MGSGQTARSTGYSAAFDHLIEVTSDGFVSIEAGRVTAWNAQAQRMLGWSADDVLGRPVVDVLATDATGRWDSMLADLAAGTTDERGRIIIELAARHRDGTEVGLTVVGWPAEGDAPCAHLLLQAAPGSDADQLQLAREQLAAEATELWHRAFHDPLTNLANRNLFRDRAEHALTRRRDGLLGLLVIDLDGFKGINDALGHAIGDSLLVAVAGRLRECVGPSASVARPGGDEFAVLVEDLPDQAAITAVADRILDRLAAPFGVDGRTLVISASMGIVIAGPSEHEVNQVIANADLALFRAKSGGRGRWAIFQPSMQTAALAKLDLETDLRRAIEAEELHVHYQPVGDLRDGRVTAVEALVRWNHPERGPVGPNDFIPVAEETGLILQLGAWVLTEACRQGVRWHQAEPGKERVIVAVNLSGRQIQVPGFADVVERILADTGWPASHLVLEITESLLMEETGASMLNLRGLRALGVKLSLDDFGTGYSSLARLRSLPVDELKIDMSFVQSIGADGDAPLVSAIIAMGHSLGLEVVAEGVETGSQLEYLRDHGCDRVQGYLLSRPAPPELVDALLGEPSPVLRLTAARAALGDRWHEVDVDIMEVVATAVSRSGDLEHVTRTLLASLAAVTGLDSTYLTRVDWAGAAQEILYAHNSGEVQVPEGMTVEWSASSSVYSDSGVASALGLQTYVAVPVVNSGGGLFGTLCGVSAGPTHLNRKELALMELYGRLIADEFDTTPPPLDAKTRTSV